MKPRLQAIMLLVDDLDRAAKFYQDLGFQKGEAGKAVARFELGDTGLALLKRSEFKGMLGGSLEAPTGQPNIVLAHMVRSQEEVDAVLAEAENAGGTIARAAGPNDWGGYSGVFADPDGHLWNVGFNLLFYRA